ncbi:MAG: SUMF1/EgtB/PvdO family nonheme iron enzyme [Treponema sp.]|nr:SUMF1/EgtB/PvdO family nonheme iron enzyme [Treponema sp.]
MKKSQHTWKRLLPACFLLAWTFFSCSDLSQETGADDGKTAYICVKSARTSGQTPAERTLLPSPDPDDLTDLVLTGTKSGSTETELARADNLDELSSMRIEIPLGEWNFTLTAQLDGVEFSGSTRAKAVAGKTVSLTFDLTTSESKGGFTLQVFFSGEANEALARIQSVSDGRYYNPLGQEITTTHDSTLTINEDDQGKKHVLLSAPIKLSGTECGFLDGSYKIQIDFNYKDGDTRCLLNTYETSVQIKAGYICKAVATLDLVGKYSVTLHFNGGSLNDSSPENDVLTGIFQRKKTVSLPGSEQMRKSGHTFAGWYDNEDLNGSAVTELAAGSQGSFDYWAKWEEESGSGGGGTSGSIDIYVKQGGTSTGAGTRADPLDSIASAVNKILDANDSSKAWVIGIDGMLSGAQELNPKEFNGELWQSIPLPAASVTLTGVTGADSDGIDAGWDFKDRDGNPLIFHKTGEVIAAPTDDKGSALTITANVPITIEKLTIKGGCKPDPNPSDDTYFLGGGILYSGGSTLTVKNARIRENYSGDGAGIAITNGTLYIEEGAAISKNVAWWTGAGVYATPDEENHTVKIIMNGGLIGGEGDEGNECISYDEESSYGDSFGGGVCVSEGPANSPSAAQFKLNNGAIKGNSAGIGAGVYFYCGLFDMADGTIEGNMDRNDSEGCGAGVAMNSGYGSRFTMTGGKILSNEAEYSAAVYLMEDDEDLTFSMQGGKISGNVARDGISGALRFVKMENCAVFEMSGDATIASDNKVYLGKYNDVAKITIAGPLTGTAPVATITPEEYPSSETPNISVLELKDGSGTSLGDECGKFAVTPNGSTNYEIDENGKLQVAGGGTSGNVVNLYVKPTGNDSNDASSQDNAVATVSRLIELMTDEDTDYIINVCGDMTESEWLLKNITGAKSITIQGNGNTNSGNKLPGVYTKSKAPITFKNIQIGAMYIDAVQIDEDSYAHANVILDSGTLIQNNDSITSIDDNGLYGVVHLFQKGAVTLTMKSGAVISNNTYVNEAAKQYGACGGIYIGQYSEFRMEGGTISGNAEYDVSNCQDGYFIVSGDAQAGKVYCKALDSADSRSAPIYIGGPLTSSTVATITPYFYPNWQALELGNDEDGNPITTTTIGDVYNKFAVTPYNSTNYEIDSNGKLQVSSGGSGIPQGFALVEGNPLIEPNSWDPDHSNLNDDPNTPDINENNYISIPDLYVCKHEVTQSEWEEYMSYYGAEVDGTEEGQKSSEKPYIPNASDDKANTPVYNISWAEAIAYCNLRSIKEGYTPVYALMINGTKQTNPAQWGEAGIVANSNGKYYSQDKLTDGSTPENANYWCVSYDGGSFYHDETANGYRLANVTEWANIVEKNTAQGSDLDIVSSTSVPVYEYLRAYIGHYSDEANRYAESSITESECSFSSGGIYYQARDVSDWSDTYKFGFRVVRNKQ